MKYCIDKNSPKATYLQLYEQIKQDIVNGVYEYGSKLPSKRTLASELNISVIPVEHAYGLLCDEGYVESRQRSGYFVIFLQDDFGVCSDIFVKTSKPQKSGCHTKSDFPYSVLAKTMRKVILDYGDRLLIKSPNSGVEELKTAISMYLARSNGIVASPEQIIIGSGAEYLYSLIVQLFDDGIIAIENPSYEKIRQVYNANKIECDMLNLSFDGVLSSELERTGAKILHLTPFNSYPSGITASASKRREYIKWAEKRNGYIIEDNYDSELTVSKKNEDTLFSLSERGSVIYLNTFSRTIAPSMRVGYMVLPENLLGRFEERVGFYSCTVPVFEQYVLARLIKNGDFERHINRIRRKKRKQI